MSLLRLVVDTNVVVSGLLNVEGAPGRVLELVTALEAVLLIDDRILEEYRAVLARPKFRRTISAGDVNAFLDLCEAFGEHVVPALLEDVTYPDPDDAPFLEVAVAGAADALVTGNLKHFPSWPGLEIVSPGRLLSIVNGAPES